MPGDNERTNNQHDMDSNKNNSSANKSGKGKGNGQQGDSKKSAPALGFLGDTAAGNLPRDGPAK